ncbi:helix-turn-helix domain-containing protein [Selenomonas sp.]|uniref:helix-turn-helix domain-containing protein n=1 Tax=Selenomonas sp. TaxID=2053611 RepID=UPI0025DA88EC|nr:helix-turn-helix domain-containing protein [Selenomonas sp.]MBQ1868526.1 DUF4115 domain-containing protein [Selenomonas sp.]
MLGDLLRSERERQGLSINDIEKGTSIRALYIESIEAGDYSQLPGEVYTKGFIRNYANFLKMDADAMVKRYMEENHPEKVAAQEEAEAAAAQKAAQEPVKTAAKAQSFSTGDDFRERVEKSHKNQNMLLIVAVVLIVAVAGFFLLGSDSKPAAKSPAPAQTSSQQAKAPAAEQPEKKAEAPKKTEGVEVVAKFNDACWTQVKADGKTIYEGTLQKGKTETWKAKEKLVVTAGNAGAVELKINGKDSGKMGEKGQVAEKIYTPDGETSAAKQSKKDSKK